MEPVRQQIEQISENLLGHFSSEDGELFLNSLKGEEEAQRDNYKGREILELLQNAVDALITDTGTGKILIELENSTFSIYNTGTPFKLDGLKSFAFPHNSTKSDSTKSDSTKDTTTKINPTKSKFIGHKGLGFRSILNWSRDIKIYSKNGLQVSYSSDETNQFYRTRLKSQGKLRSTSFPTLSYPKYLEESIDLKGYTTCIRLELLPSAIENVKRELTSLSSTTLIFLPDVTELTIKTDEFTNIFSKTTLNRSKEKETIVLKDNDTTRELEIFKKSDELPRNISPKGENYEIKLALDSAINPKKNFLYNYFRTKIHIPISWHIHTTFDLNSERNEINASDKNFYLIKVLRDFLFETAEKIAKENIKANSKESAKNNYTVVESLLKTASFDSRLDLADEELTFEDHFNNLFVAAKIFPTLAKNLIALEDYPTVLSQTDIYNYLSTKSPHASFFEKLLEPNLPKLLLETHGEYLSSPPASELFYYIDHLRRNKPLSENLDERAKLAYLLYQEYKSIYTKAIPPSLFVSNSHNNSTIAQDIYVGSKNTIKDTPSFVTFKFMNQSQYDYIVNLINQTEFENIETPEDLLNTDFAKFYHLKSINFESILADANKRLLSFKDSKKLQKNLLEYLDFIIAHSDQASQASQTPIYLLARDGKLHPADELYFGSDYGEDLCENLLGHQADLFLKSADYYQKSPTDLKMALSGLVESTPRRKENISTSDRQGTYYKYTYDHFDLILNSRPQYFFKWLLDTFSTVRESEVKMGELSRKYDNIYEKEYSEIYRIIKHTPVFKTPKGSYDFYHVFQNGDAIGERVEGIFGVKISDYFASLGIVNVDNEIDKIVSLFKIPSSYSELPVDIFYQILKTLPSFDHDGKITSNIYNVVTRDDVLETKIMKDSVTALAYKSNLKIFTNHGFVDAKKSVYAIYKEPACFDRVVNFAKIQKHTNKRRVKTIFDVDTFDRSKAEIVNNPTPILAIEEALTEDLNDLKTYLLAIRLGISQDEKNKALDLRRIEKLKITPVSEVLVSYSGSPADSLAELDFLRSQDTDEFYIVANPNEEYRTIKENPKYVDAIESIIAIEMDADRDLDIIWKMVNFPAHHREGMYISDGYSIDLLNEARKKLGIAIETQGPVPNSFTDSNVALLAKVKIDHLGKYISSIHSQIEKEDAGFKDFKNRWQDFTDFKIPDDLTLEEQELLENTELDDFTAMNMLKSHFENLDFNIPDQSTAIFATAKKNRINLHHEYLDDDREFVMSFLSSNSNESLLYFDSQFNTLKNLLSNYITKEKASLSAKTTKSEINPENLKINVEIVRPIAPKPVTSTPKRSHRHQKSPTTRSYLKNGEDNITKGGKAEYKVRKSLADSPDVISVKWHSAYATDPDYAGEFIENTSDDSVGYDISFVDKNHVTHFVEVKSCNFDDHTATITISKNEFDFANAHPDHYDLCLVKTEGEETTIKTIEAFPKTEYIKSSKNYDLTFSF